MKRWKQIIAGILMFAVMVTFMPIGAVQAAPAKPKAKDFVYTVNGKKSNFLKDTQNWQAYSQIKSEFTSKKDMKDSVKNFKTNRGIKLGDKASNVKKKYGSASKRKVNKTEIFYKSVKYDSNYGMVDLSLWKSYLEYTYKKGSDKYQIRFYLDKKEKVSAVAYLKNLDKFYNYPNKQVKSGLTFKAPKGKKVTTKTINGKKVYLLPKGTKISFSKGSISKSKFEYLQLSVRRYDEYGKFTEGTDAEDLVKNRKWKQGKKYSLSDFMKTASWDCVVDYYTAEPFCCRMSISQYMKGNDGYATEDTKVAPEQFYFILEGDSWYCKP